MKRRRNLQMAPRPLVLQRRFDPATLRSGLYQASSISGAFGPLAGMIADGRAKFEGEHLDWRGVKQILALVGYQGYRTGNPQIGIAREFFTTVLKDYDDWQEKWWREAIQNAVDAGAKRVECRAEELEDGSWKISIADDGAGMDYNTLIDKFLMLGATTKVIGVGAAGGFGKAKELLILPWLRWTVHTRNFAALGQGVEYDITEAPMRKGTFLEVVMPADQHTSIAGCLAFLQKSDLPGLRFEVFSRYKNHEWHTEQSTVRAKLKAKKLIDEVPGKAKLYVTKVDYTSSYMYVRVNGLFMFSRYMTALPRQQLITEITAPSVEILTANRDGFRDYDVRRAIDTLADEVSKDVRSAIARKAGMVRKKYEGAGKFRAPKLQGEALSVIGPIAPTDKGVTKLSIEDLRMLAEVIRRNQTAAEAIGAMPNPELARDLMDIKFDGANHVEEAIKQLVWEPDFFLVNDIEGYRIPRKFTPERMTPRIFRLAKVWTELCRYVLMQLGHYQPFGVGFGFSEHAAAQYLPDDGEHWLLLNPFVDVRERKEIWSPSKPDHIKWLYAAAVHECTHLADGITYHDEAFAAALTYNIAKTADGFRKVRGLVAKIKMRGAAAPDLPATNPVANISGLRRRLIR